MTCGMCPLTVAIGEVARMLPLLSRRARKAILSPLPTFQAAGRVFEPRRVCPRGSQGLTPRLGRSGGNARLTPLPPPAYDRPPPIPRQEADVAESVWKRLTQGGRRLIAAPGWERFAGPA